MFNKACWSVFWGNCVFPFYLELLEQVLAQVIQLPSGNKSEVLLIVPPSCLFGTKRQGYHRFWREVTEFEPLRRQDGTVYGLRVWWHNVPGYFAVSQWGELLYAGHKPQDELLKELTPFAYQESLAIDPLRARAVILPVPDR